MLTHIDDADSEINLALFILSYHVPDEEYCTVRPRMRYVPRPGHTVQFRCTCRTTRRSFRTILTMITSRGVGSQLAARRHRVRWRLYLYGPRVLSVYSCVGTGCTYEVGRTRSYYMYIFVVDDARVRTVFYCVQVTCFVTLFVRTRGTLRLYGGYTSTSPRTCALSCNFDCGYCIESCRAPNDLALQRRAPPTKVRAPPTLVGRDYFGRGPPLGQREVEAWPCDDGEAPRGLQHRGG